MRPTVAMIGLRAPGADGGIEQAVAELAPRLVDRGWNVRLYCRAKWHPTPRFQHEGVEIVDVPTVYSKHLETLLYAAFSMPSALGLGSRPPVDLVHLHAVGPAVLAPIPRLAGVPTVVTIHGLDWKRAKWGPVARAALRLGCATAARSSDGLIAVSNEIQEWLGARGHDASHVPNGVTPLGKASLDEVGIPGLEPGFLLYLGRIVPEKSLETLLEAHRLSGTRRPLLVVGASAHSDDYFDRLRRFAGRGVAFLGSRHGAAKAALVHHAAAVAFPSRLEGLPIALLEAMACGRPILASDIPPHRELLPDARHAVHLPPGDVGAWAKAISALDSRSHEELGKNALARALSLYGWDRAVDATLAVYADARRKRALADGIAHEPTPGLG